MSFSRLNYDPCTYQHNIKQSIGSADYYLGQPRVDCRACFPKDPQVNLGFTHMGPNIGVGAASCTDKPLVDVNSELLGLTRKASNCPIDKYKPSGEAFCKVNEVEMCSGLPNEQTRMSNPSCTLRCTGWNRWEWLCKNPQDKALVPFDFNISNRLVVKDNHRPCITKPINQFPALPEANSSDEVYKMPPACEQPGHDIPSIHWKKCCEYDKYKL